MNLLSKILRQPKWIIGAVVLFIMVLTFTGRKSPKADVYTVKKISIDYVTLASGTIKYPEPLNLTATEPGQVGNILVKEGSAVKKGQLIIQLDDMKERQNLEISRKNLAIARLNLTNAGSQTLPNLIEKAKTLGFNVKKAELDYDRSRQLANQNMITKSELESREQAYQAALSSFKQNQLELNSFSKSGILATLKAQVDIAKATVALAEDHLRHRKIVAPFDGLVSRVNVQFQQNIQPNTSLAVVLEKRNWVMEADVDQKELPYIAPGHPAQIRFNAYPNDAISGKLTYISPAIDTEKGTCTLKLEVLDPKPYIKHGMSGDIEIYGQKYSEVPGIPSQFLTRTPTGNQVIVWTGKRAEIRSVQGKAVGEKWLIAANVPAGTILLRPTPVKDLSKLRPGAEVNLK